MRRTLISAVMLASTACWTSGAYDAAAQTARDVRTAAVRSEAILTAVCERRVDEVIAAAPDPVAAHAAADAVLARCDAAWAAYEAVSKALDALAVGLEHADEMSPAELVDLMLRAAAAERAFEEAIGKV